MRLPRFASSFCVGLLGLAVGSVFHAIAEQPAKPAPVLESISNEVEELFAKSRDAIARIEAEDVNGMIAGTGFFIEPNGILVTSYAVGGESEEIHAVLGSERIPLKRLIADPRSGIAILKADTDKPTAFLRLGKANRMGVGAMVIAIGYPLEFPLSPSFGVASGFDMGHGGRFFAARHIRATPPVQRGQGGAPLLNAKGEVVGVIISTLENAMGLFALPGEAAAKVYHDFLGHGRVRQGWLGADVRLTDAPEHGSTARVRNLRLNGPGYGGGLRPGEVLLQVGEWKIQTPEDVLNASFYITPDEPITVQVSRAGKAMSLKITPAESPTGKGATPGGDADLLVPSEQLGLQLGQPK
jgi:S1-C subfamily serine protease